MADKALRPKKGDLFVALHNGDGSVKVLIEKRFVTPEKKAVVDKLMRVMTEGFWPSKGPTLRRRVAGDSR